MEKIFDKLESCYAVIHQHKLKNWVYIRFKAFMHNKKTGVKCNLYWWITASGFLSAKKNIIHA